MTKALRHSYSCKQHHKITNGLQLGRTSVLYLNQKTRMILLLNELKTCKWVKQTKREGSHCHGVKTYGINTIIPKAL